LGGRNRLVVEQYGDLIDYWVTMNEPHVFAMLTYCAGAWPGGDPNLLETATAAMPRGVFKVVMEAMAEAHIGAYDIIHNLSKSTKKVKVGFAHHVSFMRPYGLFDVPLVVFSNWMTRFAYCDDVAHKCDFLGINYYGQEVVSAPGLKNVEDDEYSESGRGVYPDGLYRMLLQFDERYKKYNMPFIITENGVSDATDIIRRPYIIEHLLAVRAAMDKGVKIEGYCFWTISDNWEWADGYGPKFGLVAVDRHKNLERLPRPSYYLYAEVSKTGKVTRKQRNEAWEELQSAVRQGMTRPFCRAINDYGLMFAGGLDVPIERPFAVRDWRFGHYEMEGLQDPLSSVVRYFREGAVFSSCRTNRRQKLHLDSKLA
jgi:beta-glucosidase/6-phospho-beta-glucosidase/beta-galactosidase